MAHLIQVGVGSGGMAVLDLVARDSRLHRVTIIDPDVYAPHNAVRHYFGPGRAGQRKVDLAAAWLAEHRSDLYVRPLAFDLLGPTGRSSIEACIAEADLGVCAVDSEPAKYRWDELMRQYGKPWTLGEVLSGGIGGFVHLFRPGGACYGCVASRLQRQLHEPDRPPADYANPGAAAAEQRIPASAASVHAIASLHALATLGLLDDPTGYDPGFSTLLLTLQRAPGMFEEPFQPHRLRIARSADCLICRSPVGPASVEELDVAINQALARLDHA